MCRVMRRALVFAAAVSLIGGCAGGQTSGRCAPEMWAGECQLVSVTKVVDKEFPTPIVVMEAVYRPIANATYSNFTPPAVAEQTLVRAQYELLLYDYLEAHPRVACRTQAPPVGTCVSPRVVVSVTPFDAEAAARKSPAPQVTGCAQIEATGSQDRLQGQRETQTFVAERVAFAENSSQLPPDADTLVAAVAKLLNEKAGIECLGIVGQIASGEPIALAEQRAQAVRDLLGAHGIAPTRLLTIGVTAKVFGTGSRPATGDPADRRVSFSVLLERSPGVQGR